MPLDPQPSAFFASADDLRGRLENRYGLTEASFEWELESLQRDARLLPINHQPAAGLALVELGTLGYEFSHLIDSATMAAVDEGLMIYAEACVALGRGEEALAKLRELEETDDYGLDVTEARALITKARR
ncbi:MAG: hypothetical protein JWM80_2801 [Cyanobacteria bacterium RYN_339]|nr:hypothetical protein [Cyanobacteria bacterium RYN_339]